MNKIFFVVLPLFLLLSACDDSDTFSGGPENATYCTSVEDLDNGMTRVINGCGEKITVGTASGMRFELGVGGSRDIQLQPGETLVSCTGSREIKFITLYEAECTY